MPSSSTSWCSGRRGKYCRGCWRRSGGEGRAIGDGDGDGVGIGDGNGIGDGIGDGVGVGDGIGDGIGIGVGIGDGIGIGVGIGDRNRNRDPIRVSPVASVHRFTRGALSLMMRAMRKEFAITSGGREVTVSIDRHADGTVAVLLDGVARAVDARQLRPGTWSLVIDGASFVVDLDPRRNGVAASVGLTEALLQVEDAQTRRLRQATQRGPAPRGEEVRAPIAGKVVKILCAVGDEIAVGQAVAVLEAMKMENEIVAERGGTVTDIAKAPGQSVETGERLLTLA